MTQVSGSSPCRRVMRIIVLVITCICPSLTELADLRKSKGDDHEPVTKIKETLSGKYDQKLVIDHRKYDGPGGSVERSDEEINYTYPDDVQLVPNIPITPNSPKYTLVPIKKLTADSPNPDGVQQPNDESFGPTIPSDFEQEIAKIRIPHVGLPGFITDPPPPNEENDDAEDNADDEGDESDDGSNVEDYFNDDFLEPPEFKDPVSTTRSPAKSSLTSERSRDIKILIRNRPDPRKPLIITSAVPLFDSGDHYEYHGDINNQPDEIRQIQTHINHEHEVSHGLTPNCNQKMHTPLVHYGPPQPVPAFRPIRVASPVYVRRPVQQAHGMRVYVRYPRNFRPYRHHPEPQPYNRVRVMTQNFVQHPRNYYRPNVPIMMPSVEYRAKTPGKKKKKKKAKGGKGECKPKKIIKEIHFHHYDPQLSAQLAPLEGINFKEGEDYEHDIKVITKETEIEDDVKKGHTDYDQHNSNMEKEMDRHKEETEHRLTHPEYYGDSYNPHYSDSGSTEYIDYNIQTDSQSSIHEPHPSHDYPQDRKFQPRVSNTSSPYITPLPLNGGRYLKHESITYLYKTPQNNQR